MKVNSLKTPILYNIMIIVPALLGALLSSYLLYTHYIHVPENSLLFKLCSVSETFNCDAVNTSKYSVFLGLPVAIWGLFYYLIIITVILFRESENDKALKDGLLILASTLSLVTVIMIIPLFILSQFYIKAFCLFCIFTWIINILMFIVFTRILKFETGINLVSSVLETLRSGLKILPGIYKNLKVILFSFYMLILFSFLFSLDSALSLNKAITIAENNIKKEKEFIDNFYNTKPAMVPLDDIPIYMGDKEAKIAIVEYMNFNCSACRKAYRQIKPLIKKYHDKVRLYLKNFPLDGECNPSVKKKKGGLSCTTALLSIGLYNRPGYKEFVNAIMTEKGRLDAKILLNAVQASDMSESEADEYIKNNKNRQMLLKEINDGIKIGIKATPTYIINGRVLQSGAIHPHLLEKLIKKEINRVYGN